MISHYIGMAVVCLVAITTAREYTLNVTDGYGAPDGFARPLLLVNGNTPGPIIEAHQGEQLVVTVNNMLAVQIGMHWHGLHQRGTPQHDGVPGLNQFAIPPGGQYTYCFGTESNYGAYWYHVHLRDIYQDGVRGPILIQPHATVERPYALISNKSDDLEAMQQAERSPSLLMVNDWFHQTSDEITLRMVATQDSMRPLCANSVLFNGMGRVDCPTDAQGRASFGCEVMSAGMVMGSDGMGMGSDGMGMGSMSSEMKSSTFSSKPAISSIIADMSTTMIATDVLPTATMLDSPSSMASGMPMMAAMSGSASASMTMGHDDDMCQNTTSPRYVLYFSGNTTWNMLHLINAGAAQQLALSFDEHDFWIVSADGAFVTPQNSQVINIGIGQRYAIMIRKPEGTRKVYTIRASTMTHQVFQSTALLSYGSPIANSSVQATSSPWIDVEGKPLNSTVRLLDENALAPYPVEVVPASNREIRLDVNQSDPTVWVLESGQPFASNNGQQTPLLFAPRNASGIFWLSKGDVVDVLLQIAVDSLDTMAHPIHLHGHYFRVLGSLANSTFPTNMSINDVASSMSDNPVGMSLNTNSTAPRRDSAHLPEGGWLAIRFVADNPGVWLLHCHINSHLASGMAVAFIEAADDLPTFPDYITTPPKIAPLPSISELE